VSENKDLKKREITPPKLARRILLGFLREDLVEEVTGDLDEKFFYLAKNVSLFKAQRNYWYQVFQYFRPFAIQKARYNPSNQLDMLQNYFKISWRNLHKNLGYSLINIGGLAVGMCIAILIGLWMYDELTFDQYHENYDRVAQVIQKQTFNGYRGTQYAIPIPLAAELHKTYGEDFKYIVLSSWTGDHILSHGENKISKTGNFMDVDAPKLLSLKMLKGSAEGFKEPNSILLSETTARALFGDKDPLNELMRIDNNMDVKVAGVYEDLPYNSSSKEVFFIGPWELYVTSSPWIKRARDESQWGNNSFQLYAQIAENSSMEGTSKKIKNAKYDRVAEDEKKFKAEILLHPMKDWHLRSNWENGIQTGGQIQYVWLFGVVGIFVLLLACINFMNLSTARSEKRAKEVGIRKSVGSARKQLITQFLSESFMIVSMAFVVAIILIVLVLPGFNQLADKKIIFPLTNGYFWASSLIFILFTAFISGSYPALYLSSFQPVKVLKGTFRAGRFATVPRQVLVVIQFTVSVVLITGTIIVYSQIQFTKNRPIGYENNGLIMIEVKSPDYKGKFEMLRNDLKNSGAVEEMALSSSPLTGVWSNNGGFNWEGKDPDQEGEFGTIWISPEFGKVINWELVDGRDFSNDLASDSSSIIINETGVKFMNVGNPIGKTIRWGDDSTRGKFVVIGVVKDLLMESPFRSVKQTVFLLNPDYTSWIELKLNPLKSANESIALIKNVFSKHVPDVPFDYKFVDQEHAEKFADEERIGKLSGIFAGLAVFISCLGLFGLASFVAEQRTKEIGIRKVLGASIASLWQMLSRDFVLLVVISCIGAIPLAYYSLNRWLLNFEYRTDIKWWFFAVPALAALLITLLTVSFQAVKAALMNPVKSLRSE
jgi:putative ABC transport system permease protein